MDSNINQIQIDEQQEISLKEIIIGVVNFFQFFRKKWKIILLFSLIGALVGYCYGYFQKPQFKAVVSYAMEEDKGTGTGLTGALGLASSFGIDLGGGGGGGAFSANNLVSLMKSRLIIEKVLLQPIEIYGRKMSLADFYIQTNNLKEEWKDNPKLRNISFKLNLERKNFSFEQDSIMFFLHKNLTLPENLQIIQKDKKITILDIEVINQNELFAKLFCENLAKETSNFYIETKSKKARINTLILQKQVDSVKQQLNKNIYGVAYSVDHLYNLNPAHNVQSSKSKQMQVDVSANSEVLKQLTIQLELSKITLRKETPLIQLIDTPILPLENLKVSKLKSMFIGALISFFAIIFFIYSKNYIETKIL